MNDPTCVSSGVSVKKIIPQISTWQHIKERRADLKWIAVAHISNRPLIFITVPDK